MQNPGHASHPSDEDGPPPDPAPMIRRNYPRGWEQRAAWALVWADLAGSSWQTVAELAHLSARISARSLARIMCAAATSGLVTRRYRTEGGQRKPEYRRCL